MSFLKILWQHLFQQRNTPSEEGEALSALTKHFPMESLSTEELVKLVKNTDFQELVTEDGPLQFRFAVHEGEPESASEELAFQVSELSLEFEPPTFPDDDLELNENEMQGLDENFWENYVFDERFAQDIPNFAEPEFESLPFDALKLEPPTDRNSEWQT